MLNVHQIYFKPEQLAILDYTPYLNEDCTVFFENEVIRSLVRDGQHKKDEYFGVVGYQLREKIGAVQKNWRSIPNIANWSEQEFSPSLFEAALIHDGKPDAMSFQRHRPHDPIMYADRFHPGFSSVFSYIMEEIGYAWKPTHLEHVFYCQYFVAKQEWYQRFCEDMLFPAMLVMADMPELMMNSGYPKPLPEDLKQKWGINWYPYHSFVCERMFSYFAHIHKLKCSHF